MANTKTLLTIDYHFDDETGMYHIGEIDFGIHGTLRGYIETYGYEGVKDILATLGHLAWEVKQTYYEIQKHDQDLNKKSND